MGLETDDVDVEKSCRKSDVSAWQAVKIASRDRG
jgi:hypothetical protein